jgi:hypothetical protein
LINSLNINHYRWFIYSAILILSLTIGLVYFHFLRKNQQEEVVDLNCTAELLINHNEGGEVSGNGIYPVGSKVKIWASPYPGYTFKEWVGENISDLGDNNTTILIEGDSNITASFIKVPNVLKLETDSLNSFSIRDLEGFETSEYFAESGKKMVTLKFQSARIENPKVGFLRLGLAFLMVENLEIILNTNGLSTDFLNSKILELKKEKGVSYAVAEPATIWLQEDNFFTKISSSKGKLTDQGEFRLWDGVEIKTQTNIRKFKKVKIHIEKEKNWLSLTDLESGQAIDYIQLD